MNSKNLSFPWGTEDLFVHNQPVTVKFLRIKAGEAPSLQYHRHRDEFWKIISGNPDVVVGDDTLHSKIDDEFSIPALTQHRILATDHDAVVLEISFGNFDEKDIVRLEDKYGRV